MLVINWIIIIVINGLFLSVRIYLWLPKRGVYYSVDRRGRLSTKQESLTCTSEMTEWVPMQEDFTRSVQNLN